MRPIRKPAKTKEAALKNIASLRIYLEQSGLESPLAELVKMRTSQISGCDQCIEMHTKEARAAGESSQRVRGVAAWHEFPFYNARERAALAWAEVLARLSETEVTDEIQQLVREHFEEEDLDTLTTVITTINNWKS